MNIDGGTVTVKGSDSVGVSATKDVTLSYGKIEAVGDRACGLSVLRGATFNAEKNYYQPDFFSLRAEGEHAVGLLIADGVFSATIQNSLVEGIGSEAYAIKASSDMLAVYTRVDGRIDFADGRQITAYLSTVPNDHSVQRGKERIFYETERIIVDGILPEKQTFTVSREDGTELGHFTAHIQWEESGENILKGKLDICVETEPLMMTACLYTMHTKEESNAAALAAWCADDKRRDSDVYTLQGDIVIEEPTVLAGDAEVTIDTNGFTIFIREKLTVQNRKITIYGKGNALALLCIDRSDSNGEICMPNGGVIRAESACAVLTTRGLNFIGRPQIYSDTYAMRLMNSSNFIRSADICGEIHTETPLIVANSDLTHAQIACDFFYTLCLVPENAQNGYPIDVQRYSLDSLGEKIVTFASGSDIEGQLPKTVSVILSFSEPRQLQCYVDIPVVWDDAEIRDCESGTYSIVGQLQTLTDEELALVPSLLVDIVPAGASICVLGMGGEENRYQDTRVYFKIPEDFPMDEDSSFFALQYARSSIQEGAEFGTIAPSLGNGHIGYFVSDLDLSLPGYGMILLDQKRFEYGFLTEDSYVFRVKAWNGERVYYSDESRFPADGNSTDEGGSVPSTPTDNGGEGGRGGGNRENQTSNTTSVSATQVGNLLNAGKQQNTFTVNGVSVTLTQKTLQNLKSGFVITAQKEENSSYTLRMTQNGKTVTGFSDMVLIRFPYSGGNIRTVCRRDGSIVRNGCTRSGKYQIKTAAFGNFTFQTDTAKNFWDVKKHWAKDSIDFGSVRQIISGYADGSFRPNNTTTEAEFKKMLDSILTNNPVAFQKTQSALITRGNVARMIYLAYGNGKRYNTSGYSDTSGMNQTYINAIAFVSEKGLMRGRGNGKFAPYAHLTRAEAIQIIRNAVESGL